MTEQERQERMEKLFEKMLNMEMTNREMYEQCRNVAHKPMTNEEWFCGLSTEEKAEWIFQIFGEGVTFGETHGKTKLFPNDDIIHEGLFVDWLKEKHK